MNYEQYQFGKSIYQLTLVSDPAKEWVEDNVHTEPWQWMGKNILCIEWRYVDPLVDGMMDAGLEEVTDFTVS